MKYRTIRGLSRYIAQCYQQDRAQEQEGRRIFRECDYTDADRAAVKDTAASISAVLSAASGRRWSDVFADVCALVPGTFLGMLLQSEMVATCAANGIRFVADDERRPTISENKEEDNTVYIFTASTISINGQTFPVEYSVTPARKTVVAFFVRNGQRESVRLVKSDADHAAALAAATAAANVAPVQIDLFNQQEPEAVQEPAQATDNAAGTFETDAQEPEDDYTFDVEAIKAKRKEYGYDEHWNVVDPIANANSPVSRLFDNLAATFPADNAAGTFETDAQEPEEETSAAQEQEQEQDHVPGPKDAHGPVPPKTFAGTRIDGFGWTIIFDVEANRTRVTFDGPPTDEMKQATENAGFYFSSRFNSWNKKLTHRAHRAALALAAQLQTMVPAVVDLPF